MMFDAVGSIHARKFTLRGVVQGVGFRPFVYRLAKECEVKGTVANNGLGVEILAQGARLDEFERRLLGEAPPASMIVEIQTEEIENGIAPYTDFVILPSGTTSVEGALVPPDLAVCEACLREMFDPADRRYRYPFINCTDCGPRYTITRSLPYDRPYTSMAHFPMCPVCEAEYRAPENRRYHAQPNACPDCGPRLRYTIGKGEPIIYDEAALSACIETVAQGGVVAVRGIGGYHLVCDATNEAAVSLLRERKRRFRKPLAVMAANMEAVRKFCSVSEDEERLLTSPQRPIVLLDRLPVSAVGEDVHQPADSVAPGNATLGVMLPYAPLHYLLMQRFEVLVMTSANLSEEPICIAPDEAERRLDGIADGFLHHDRDIVVRCDDSVMRVLLHTHYPVRRARGYAPKPILLRHSGPQVFAAGAELENTFCATKGRSAFLSQHVGDLENLETLAFFEETAVHLLQMFELAPEAVAHDMHPEYLGTKWASGDVCLGSGHSVRLEERFALLPRFAVQHHHAHLCACMAEHGLEGDVLGIILDGTGYGEDGTIWGGEFLVGGYGGYERAGWFGAVPMPGGDAAIREPWRMAAAWLHAAFGERLWESLPSFAQRRPDREREALEYALRTNLNTVATSSCGRLFDAVASLTGLFDYVNFEAEAAIALEHAAAGLKERPYPFDVDGTGSTIVRFENTIRAVADDVRHGVAVGEIASRFHATVIEACVEAAKRILVSRGLRTIVLSGGVFQNRLFAEGMYNRLASQGWAVYVHRQVPCNDGGVALGQAVIVQQQMQG